MVIATGQPAVPVLLVIGSSATVRQDPVVIGNAMARPGPVLMCSPLCSLVWSNSLPMLLQFLARRVRRPGNRSRNFTSVRPRRIHRSHEPA
jgi:hypothetical protein